MGVGLRLIRETCEHATEPYRCARRISIPTTSLAGIRAASLTGDEASREVASQLKSMDAELEADSLAIEQQRADIQRAQAFLLGCHGCQRKPTRTVCDSCEVSAGISDIAVMRVVWDERSPD